MGMEVWQPKSGVAANWQPQQPGWGQQPNSTESAAAATMFVPGGAVASASAEFVPGQSWSSAAAEFVPGQAFVPSQSSWASAQVADSKVNSTTDRPNTATTPSAFEQLKAERAPTLAPTSTAAPLAADAETS